MLGCLHAQDSLSSLETPREYAIFIGRLPHRGAQTDPHPDVIVSAHLEGDNTVVVTVKQFANSPKASAKVIFKNVGLNSTLTGGKKVRL